MQILFLYERSKESDYISPFLQVMQLKPYKRLGCPLKKLVEGLVYNASCAFETQLDTQF